MPIKDEKKKKEAQQRADAKRAGKRARAWTALMYQESAPDGWMEKLSNLLVEALYKPFTRPRCMDSRGRGGKHLT